MTNIDQALVDQMAQTITGALVGCDLRATGAAVYGGNVAAGAVTPLIAAAVDAARAEGEKQGAARVREAVEEALPERPDLWPCIGEAWLALHHIRTALKATP